jgi:hypothetical protein
VNDFKQYTINYDYGTITIGELPIGARVMDPSWEWEFRDGKNYSGSGPVKPITWIIVAKNHYGLEKAHITLLSEKVIGRCVFDNSTNRACQGITNPFGEANKKPKPIAPLDQIEKATHEAEIAKLDQMDKATLEAENAKLDRKIAKEIAKLERKIAKLDRKIQKDYAKFERKIPKWNRYFSKDGCNHWGESGTANATSGLLPWLNSNGIHSGEGFYRVFSESFKNALVTTSLPNREWKSGSAYSTQDIVFIPSTTELGDTDHQDTFQVGLVYPYFQEAGDAERIACIEHKYSRLGMPINYYTRSPKYSSMSGNALFEVSSKGGFRRTLTNWGRKGVRPALNLKAECLVSEIRE